MKVLIAEDNSFSCKLLVKTLEKAGYTPIVAEDGDTAWDIMQSEQAPSMVLLDWMMPGLQGVEVCTRIRSLEKTVPPYIIMLTARADRDDVVQGFEAGADDYLKKPYDSSELLARLKVGERLVQQQALMHTLIDSLPDPIYVKDSRGLYLGCNDAYAAFAGTDKDQIGQKQATDVLPSAQANKSHMDDLRALAADEPMESEEWTVDAEGKNVFHYSMRIPLMESSSGLRGLLVLHRDVSHESVGEKQLRYQHKMSVLGSVLSNVSHEFKNIINAMMGFASLGLDSVSKENEAHEYLSDIYTSGESAKELLEKLLDFSHKENQEMELLSLESVVEDSLGLVRMMKAPSVVLEFSAAADLPPMYGDRVQLQQIVTNLCVNALYAMDNRESAVLTLRIEPSEGENSEEPSILFSVEDTGCGIPADVKDEIFEPHFSTREGEGSGLGLAIVKTIVDQHQGSIDVESQEGAGSCFRIRFPAKV